jgi:hypothetical protein
MKDLDMTSLSHVFLCARCAFINLWRDTAGIAAVEFATTHRKVVLATRTLSDIVAQYNDDNPFTSAMLQSDPLWITGQVLTPYSIAPIRATITQIVIDDKKVAKVQWSKSATYNSAGDVTLTASARNKGDIVTLDTALQTPSTYLIMSEIKYDYAPIVGYESTAATIKFSTSSYAGLRQARCLPLDGVAC